MIVLQLRLRREILSFIAGGPRRREQICERFDLSPEKADYHLSMLQSALVIEMSEETVNITSTGALYLKNVEARR